MALGNPGGDQATADGSSQPWEREAPRHLGTVLPGECLSCAISVHGGQTHQRSGRPENLPPEGLSLREDEESEPSHRPA